MLTLYSICFAALSASAELVRPAGVSLLQLKASTRRAQYEPDADFEDPDGMTIEEEAAQGSMIDDYGELDLDAVENGDQDMPDPVVYPGEDVALEDANDEENNYQPSHDHANVIHHGTMRYTNQDLK
eukprot:g14425.t1